MGSNQFQREYIEYLQKRNNELLNKFNHMKESYENKILSRDLNKHYLISTLEEVLNVCTLIPQEIDIFFDKMTTAMSALKDILLKKSEMMQLVEKISRVLTSTENCNTDFTKMHDPDLVTEQISESKSGKKGTVKVSPMINGHIISTDPRIYLSRIPGAFTPERRVETHQLSPIIEASPDITSDPSNLRSQNFKEIKIPLERINLSRMSCNYMSEESPKSRFKGPKRWKKSLSCNKNNVIQTKTAFLENKKNLKEKLSLGEDDLPQSSETLDPLEGPSWLYEENPEMNSPNCPNGFVNFSRRKHRFATVFDKDESCLNYEKSKMSLKEDPNDFYEYNKEANDEKQDLEEIGERISESSEDFICESFSSDWEEKLPTKKKRQSIKRKLTKASSDKHDSTELDKDFKKETSIQYLKNVNKKSVLDTPTYSDSVDEDDNEDNSVQKLSKSRESFRKLPLKLSSRRTNSELWSSMEKTPRRSMSNEGEAQISKRSKDSKGSKKSMKELVNEVFVKLEDCTSAKKNFPKKSLTSGSNKKNKFKRSTSKSKSRSPVVVLVETEGRVKRKAAPSFKLVEPKLKTKLRRE